MQAGALYDGFDAVGLQYGPGYRTLEHAWGSGVGVAAARLRAEARAELARFVGATPAPRRDGRARVRCALPAPAPPRTAPPPPPHALRVARDDAAEVATRALFASLGVDALEPRAKRREFLRAAARGEV